MEQASGTVHPIVDAWVHARLQGLRPAPIAVQASGLQGLRAGCIVPGCRCRPAPPPCPPASPQRAPPARPCLHYSALILHCSQAGRDQAHTCCRPSALNGRAACRAAIAAVRGRPASGLPLPPLAAVPGRPPGEPGASL